MIKTFNITQRAKKHIKKGIACNVYSASKRMHIGRYNKEIVVAAVASGIKDNGIGSKIAVEAFIDTCERNLKSPVAEKGIMKIMDHAYKYASNKITLDNACTLTGVVYDGHNLYFGYLGDGIVVLYSDGEYEMISGSDKGKEYGLYSSEWQYGKSEKEVISVALISRGVLNSCERKKIIFNRVFFSFLESTLTSKNKDYPGFKNRTKDDMSLVILQNRDSLKQMNVPIKFNSKKWKQILLNRNKGLHASLYDSFYEYRKIKDEEMHKKESEYFKKYDSHTTDIHIKHFKLFMDKRDL